MALPKRISIAIVFLSLFYLAICLSLRWGQRKLIFFPDSTIKSTPQKHNLNYQDVWIDIKEDKIHGWWIEAAKESAPVLLYFHGNGSNNGDLVDFAFTIHQLGLSILLVDYRGYGKSSPIFPNETRVYEDAEAAWQYLTDTKKIEPGKIITYGHSLGGAIAIELATKHPEMAGLITEGTFTSMKNIAKYSYPLDLFPLNLLITQRFDSINKIKSLQVPLLMFHGTLDEVIPLFMAKELFAAAPQPKQLVIIPNANHNNLDAVGGQQYQLHIKQFVDTVVN